MTRVEAAISRAVAFLGQAQLPSGEIPVFLSLDPAMQDGCTSDPCVFPTALAALALSCSPEAAAICNRAEEFLAAEMGPHALWKHWPRDHPHAASLPPDVDDTSCASAVLHRAGRRFPDNRSLLLANRDREGRFLTWFVPRPRLRAAAVTGATWRALLRLPALLAFFRLTSAKLGDVDAAVNANALAYLGEFPGRDRVSRWLIEILESGTERDCDKWYENPFVVRYLFSRAIGATPDGRHLLTLRTRAAAPRSMLDHALAASTLAHCGADAGSNVTALISGQLDDGSWPAAAFYHGGRKRLSRGGFAPPHPDTPHWGSEALTTAIAVEALARSESLDAESRLGAGTRAIRSAPSGRL